MGREDLESLFGGCIPQGGFVGPRPEELFRLASCFLLRPAAEQDPTHKQLIPYQLFRWRDCFFVYQRGGGVGERRLAGRLSVGIGGHINAEDAQGGQLTYDAYMAALLREREEELVCKTEMVPRFLGWINDDSDSVGQVHLGAVHLCEVEDMDDMRIRENGEDIHACGWWNEQEIWGRQEEFEKWSLLAMELAATAAPNAAAMLQK